MKVVLGVVGAVALLIIVVAVIAVGSIDSIARRGVERGGTYAMQVPTTLDDADVGIMRGAFAMRGLEVKNPEGYSAPHFVRMSEADVDVSLNTLSDDVVELPTLTISGVDMYLVKEGGKANYQVIMENLKRFESDGPTDESKQGKKFVIRTVRISDVTVHATVLPIGGSGNTVDVVVPEIVLTDVGSGGKSVSMAEVFNIIIKAVFATAINLGGALPGEIVEGLEGGLSQLGSLGEMGVGVAASVGGKVVGIAGDAAKALGELPAGLGEEAGKAVEDAAKGVEEGIRGILGGDRKKDE